MRLGYPLVIYRIVASPNSCGVALLLRKGPCVSVRRLGLIASAAALLTLSACGDDTTDEGTEPAPDDTAAEESAAPDGDGASSSAPAGDEGAPAAGEFPATVETAFGPVTIEEEPQRVVALGWGDAETALALDVQPIGASDWLGFGGEGVGPWAAGLYDSPPEIIDTLEPSYEAIGALEPDLILDVKSSGDPERYERLSQIATTVGIPEGGESYLTTTDQQVELISGALGVPEQGQALLDDLEADFATAAEAHPEWEGQTVTAATRTSEGWGAYVEGSERVQFLERLGFVQNPQIAELPADETGFSVSISEERLDLMDADLIVAFPIFIETTQITEDPLWLEIPAVQDGHAVVIDGDLSSAYSLGTTLANEYALENLVPMLEEATAQ